MEWIAQIPAQNFNLSRNTVLQSLEVRASYPPRGRGPTLKELLSTIASPVFSEIVIVFSEEEVCWPPWGLAKVLREVHEVRGFRLAFCLEIDERLKAANLRALKISTQAEVARGHYDFLPCPPLVFFRHLAR